MPRPQLITQPVTAMVSQSATLLIRLNESVNVNRLLNTQLLHLNRYVTTIYRGERDLLVEEVKHTNKTSVHIKADAFSPSPALLF